jgi:hypothetical protein
LQEFCSRPLELGHEAGNVGGSLGAVRLPHCLEPNYADLNFTHVRIQCARLLADLLEAGPESLELVADG